MNQHTRFSLRPKSTGDISHRDVLAEPSSASKKVADRQHVFVFSKQSHCRDGASLSFVWRSPPRSYRFTVTFWYILYFQEILLATDCGKSSFFGTLKEVGSGRNWPLLIWLRIKALFLRCFKFHFLLNPPPHTQRAPTLASTMWHIATNSIQLIPPCVCLCPWPLHYIRCPDDADGGWKRGAGPRINSLIFFLLKKERHSSSQRNPGLDKKTLHFALSLSLLFAHLWFINPAFIIQRHIGKG